MNFKELLHILVFFIILLDEDNLKRSLIRREAAALLVQAYCIKNVQRLDSE